MPLSREQYDSIMLEYARKQDRRRHEIERRRAAVYSAIPGFRTMEERIPSLGLDSLKAVLGDSADSASSGTAQTAVSLREQLSAAADERKELLLAHGFTADYLDPPYECPDCRDTGYIGIDKCHCFRQQEISLLYHQSNIRALAETDNFSTLSDIWYTGEDLDRFHKAVQASRQFINEFDSVRRNLYFYGTVGTGKSFLSVCIAHDLIESGHSVIYFSASDLFDRISAYSFDYKAKEQLARLYEDLYGCDLLIIDDLGTEMTTAFVTSQLFACINERHLREKATVISTNLSLGELQGRYSDRVFSRVYSLYDIYRFTGMDIRIQKARRAAGQNR